MELANPKYDATNRITMLFSIKSIMTAGHYEFHKNL